MAGGEIVEGDATEESVGRLAGVVERGLAREGEIAGGVAVTMECRERGRERR